MNGMNMALRSQYPYSRKRMAITMTLYDFDNAIYAETHAVYCGVDEAGRGPLAGPVYAAAVILPRDIEIQGLNDSKKLTEKKREALYGEIVEKSVSYSIATASVDEIEELNILNAAMLAMRRAVQWLAKAPALALVDGNTDPKLGIVTRLIVGGDAKSACVAAASILAKVARDRHMLELDRQYPQYGFAKHKGYGTKLHYSALDEFGACPAHRESFLKKWRAKAV